MIQRTALILPLLWALATVPLATAQDWIYKARQGDTLWDLCLEYTNKRGCWIELGKYNQVENDRGIPPGSEIRIPMNWLLKIPTVGLVQHVQGDVLYDEKSNGETTALSAGQALALGSTITSQQGNAKLLLGEHSELLLRPNSVLKLENLSSSEEANQSAEVRLESGDVEARVKPRSKTRFEIYTPSAIAAVRGTGYRVSSLLDESSSTRSEVLTGQVAVKASDEQVIPAGFGIMAQRGQALDEPRELLPPPVFTREKVNSIPPASVQWQSDPLAVAWRLDLRSDAASGAQLLQSWRLDKPQISLTGLADGCYQVVLRAIDSDGFNGLENQLPVCIIQPLPAVVDFRIEKLEDSVEQYRVTWSAPAGAQAFLIEVAKDAEFTETVSSAVINFPDALVSPGGTKPFFVRVTAIDKDNNYGVPSAAVEHNKPGYMMIGLTAAAALLLAVALL